MGRKLVPHFKRAKRALPLEKRTSLLKPISRQSWTDDGAFSILDHAAMGLCEWSVESNERDIGVS